MRSFALRDPVTTGALAASAVLMLVRPRTVSRIAAVASLAPRPTQDFGYEAARRRKTAGSTSFLPAAAKAAVGHLASFLSSCVALSPWGQQSRLDKLARKYAPRRGWLRDPALTRRIGRRLNDSAAVLAFSVLADSAVEHYRGSFQNRAMYAPLAAAALTLGGSLFGSFDPRARKHFGRDTIYAAAALTGFAGLAFHSYNILKRPGGWSWLNLFYAAPVGAPMALALAGLLGRGGERVRDTPPGRPATILGLPAGQTLGAVVALGLAGTAAEAALLHFRGAYHDPAMFLPVSLPPVAAALLGASALGPGAHPHRITRWWLRLTALLGFAGVGFHSLGVARNMGGWRNWRQNVLNGPPLPAPPSFTGLALAGLAALSLIEEESDA